MALGAASADRLFGTLEARRVTNALSIATDDGSLGVQGRVTDAARSILERSNIDVIYACGPMPMLSALTTLGGEFDVMVQCAVEESMACGIGICMTCVLPVRGSDGVVRMSRSCVDGPVFAGDRVLWESIGSVPEETLGAPKASEHL
jgi:dihydroorotate dehydrogenase electron transfer subunit